MSCLLKTVSKKSTWLILILALAVAGCTPDTTSPSSKLRLSPLNNQDTVNLNANDIVSIMRSAGFSDDQILEHGTRMHQDLLESGAVQLKVDDKIEAIFAVNNNYIYIATRMRGSFIYNTKTGQIVSSAQL